uniref:HAT C-terminal dimerisation domain-containing protein n=1 Tax=Triticum urartu TaxID=4572 RepID=A0A8R7K3D9_TRIUA
MASMYGELISAKREIKVAVENSKKDYLVITNVMNTKMSGRLDSRLHMAAYILNPKYSYADPSIFTDVEVVAALMEVMETFYHDDDMKQNKVFNMDFTKFKKKKGMFGNVAALKAMDNNNFDAGDWWSTYGLQTPTLQHMAIRILNLTTSSSGCERNWSTFEMVDAKRRNKLDVARRDNLVYIQFNGRMIDKRKKLSSSSDVLLGEDVSRAQDWICEDAYIDDEFDPTTGVPYNIIDEAMEESEPTELRWSA